MSLEGGGGGRGLFYDIIQEFE